MHPVVAITALLTGIFTVAIIAEVLSQKAQTTSVISSAASGLASVIHEAVSPITGASNVGNTLASTQPSQIVSP